MTDQARASYPPRRGLMLVLSSPSGAGKTTLSRQLLNVDKDITLSISVTTRQRRPSEIDGVHYHFIDQKRFKEMRDGGELLEWAEVHGNHYATPRAPVEEALAAGRDVMFDIDWQGTHQLARKVPDDLVSIFILPPSMAELSARLVRRAEDAADTIARRLANARSEMTHWNEYDYVVVNDDVSAALMKIRVILGAERMRRRRQPGLESFVDGLLNEA